MVSDRRFVAAVALAALWSWQPGSFALQTSPPSQSSPQTGTRDEIDILHAPAVPSSAVAEPRTPPVTACSEIKIPQFTSCSITELQTVLPELRTLKPSRDQSQVVSLLRQIGAKTAEMAFRTPNLLSNESVLLESQGTRSRQNFSFLILQRKSKSNTIVLDEFRVRANTGEKFQTDFFEKAAEASRPSSDPSLLDLEPGNFRLGCGGAPLSQGFISQWLNFYPTNQSLVEFRYLGEHAIDGREMQVVAFAQKPGLYPLPVIFEGQNKMYRIFMQGVAWVDAADSRIAHLRTEILSLPPGICLRQLSSEIDFSEVRIVGAGAPLWLPRQVVVTSNISGSKVRETHIYSNYRLFRTKSKLLGSP